MFNRVGCVLQTRYHWLRREHCIKQVFKVTRKTVKPHRKSKLPWSTWCW